MVNQNDKITSNNTLLSYVYDEKSVSKETFLPAVAYVKDGNITGRMYDTFLFLPASSYIYGKSSGGFKKNDLLEYINIGVFNNNGNLDSLEQAALETREALNDNFTVEVVMTVIPPEKNTVDFGEINGKEMDLTKTEDMKSVIKWMVDEQISQFLKKDYKALKLSGFYWFHESIHPTDDITIEMVKYFTAYVRSLGYYSCWIPFHGAEGCDSNSIFGFDRVNMQGNFFAGNPDFPNNFAYSDYFGHQTAKQTFERAANIINTNGLSFEMEFGGDVNNKRSVTGFKLYMLYAIKLGYMYKNLYYYMGGGSGPVFDLCNSDDPYVRSTYDEMYKFFNKTLKETDIEIQPKNAENITAQEWY
ncbi:DUF4855 domain-containing protein [Eubacteriales bacterium OttesenSCG-928-G02]|nr:DUF4855 domain-containing protein [Eubacteriales bacterium OttesenSCG-928-G02]